MGCDAPLFDFLYLSFQFNINHCISFIGFRLITLGYEVIANSADSLYCLSFD